MKPILIAYASMAGSTAEVAQTVAETLTQCGLKVETRPLKEVSSLEGYSAVVVGAPMIMGYHRDAVQFLHKHRKAFQQIPLAVFATAMRLTRTADMTLDGVPVYLDEKLPEPPAVAGKLTFKENYATISNYSRPILQAVRPIKPKSVAFFGGRLEYGRLKWWAVLFAMVIIQAPAGNRINPPAIRAWAASLPEALGLNRNPASA